MPASTHMSKVLNTRTARLAAGSVLLVGALVAGLSAANAWADSAPGTRPVAHHPGGEGPPGAMMMGGRMLERMLDDVKATDAQRAQIGKIQENARADLAKLHAQHAALRQQTLTLLTAPTVDTAAIEKVRQQMLQQHDAISKRMLTAMIDSSQVLTPEQRATVANHLKERQERRAERRDHGGTPGHDGKRPERHPGAAPAPTQG